MNRARALAAFEDLLSALAENGLESESKPVPKQKRERVRAVPSDVDELARQRAKQLLKRQGFA